MKFFKLNFLPISSVHFSRIQCQKLFVIFLTVLLVACGGDDSKSPPIDEPPITEPPIEQPPVNDPPVEEPPLEEPPIAEPPSSVTEAPSNQIMAAFFRDQDGATGKLSGIVTVEAADIIDSDPAKVESVWLYWADAQGNKQGDAWLKTAATAVYSINIPTGTNLPESTNALLLLPTNSIGQATKGTLIAFHDFIGNAELSGLGGNEIEFWQYGVDRPKIAIQRSEEQGGLCIFDNGLVSVIDMKNTKDSNSTYPKEVNDNAFPPYSFLCDTQPSHSADIITDDIYGVWTYSTLNDTMFYGTVVYDSFVKYLGEPPLAEKIRIRVHYGAQYDQSAFWDGAYANFGDAYPLFYSMASLDAIAHEVGHGVLNRVSDLNLFEHEISTDARTLHEAFADISAVMAKYEFTGDTNNWHHEADKRGLGRRLNQLKTEYGAIDSLLDYDDAGANYYLRIGMITYPFYLLSNQWGIEPTYNVYINSARNCWRAMTTLTEAAECIKQQAGIAGLPEEDVIAAFKTVKIKLFDEGVLSHFNVEKIKLHTEFQDDSRTTSQVVQWHWDFGDGQTSTESNPTHTFAEAGSYPVKLTVTDQSDDQDSFERLVEVTDQYCRIGAAIVDTVMTTVSISGSDINYNATKWDYTQLPIELTDASSIDINIKGNNPATQFTTTWKIWIDLNDNGIYGDEANELVVDETIAAGFPYAFTTSLDLSALPNDDQAKYMRIIGDYVVVSPCSSQVGEALDVRVKW